MLGRCYYEQFKISVAVRSTGLIETHLVAQRFKASAYNVGYLGSIPGSGRSPGEGNGNPLQYLPGKSHGQRSLGG